MESVPSLCDSFRSCYGFIESIVSVCYKVKTEGPFISHPSLWCVLNLILHNNISNFICQVILKLFFNGQTRSLLADLIVGSDSLSSQTIFPFCIYQGGVVRAFRHCHTVHL